MKHLVLALLAGGGAYGYELKQSLDDEFGDLLPALNPGQIYMTLGRLDRDGLVAARSVPGDSRGKRIYRLTESGRAELAEWVERPIAAEGFKDEFFMKLVVVAAAGLATARRLISVQRREYLRSLRDIDARLDAGDTTMAADLLAEGAVLHLKADLEWLDLIEQRMTERGAYA
jgi:DNA-binding PadR family transcriptional regulator